MRKIQTKNKKQNKQTNQNNKQNKTPECLFIYFGVKAFLCNDQERWWVFDVFVFVLGSEKFLQH